MQWLNGNISFFCKKMYLGLISYRVDGIRCIKIRIMYILFILQWDIYRHFTHTWDSIYVRARVFTFKTQQNNKKSFLLNDLHLRNRDKPLTTILFLCYNFGFLVKVNCHVVVVCASFSSFSLFLDLGPSMGKCICTLNIVKWPFSDQI